MATTLEFGQCDRCSENNAYKSELCRKCGEALPWSRQRKQSLKAQSQSIKAANQPAKVWRDPNIAGFPWHIAALAFFFPVIGVIMYLIFNSGGDDDNATAAGRGVLAFIGLLVVCGIIGSLFGSHH